MYFLLNEEISCWLITALKISEKKTQVKETICLFSAFYFFQLCLHPNIFAWVCKDDVKDSKIVGGVARLSKQLWSS